MLQPNARTPTRAAVPIPLATGFIAGTTLLAKAPGTGARAGMISGGIILALGLAPALRGAHIRLSAGRTATVRAAMTCNSGRSD